MFSQQSVTIQIDASQTRGPFHPVWAYFGYDEPNYTYAADGQQLLQELAELSKTPIQVRTHNLLTTGDGSAALKWGSTNAYTEDAAGHAVYNWTIVDKIFDTYRKLGIRPFVEIGFMPKALSTHPDPYQHSFPHGDIYTGWSYPPSNYDKWGELVYQFVKHCADKYGRTEVQTWSWEVWNEPDIGYWHGTPEEYDKLYDYSVASVRRALPEAHVGGPASTGPSGPKAAAFLKQFLEHCATGTNYVTGQPGAPLDFISFHAKGHPQLSGNQVVMGLSRELQDVAQGFQIVHSSSKFKALPIILSEADPEGCAACSGPANAYRNSELYAAYTAVAMNFISQLAVREDVNLQGILTWAFEFEGQPYFEGFRTLATNGVDKPILNFFRMAGVMNGDMVATKSTGGTPLDAAIAGGITQPPDVDAVAVRSSRRIAALVWNYSDDEKSEPPANVGLDFTGLPADVAQVLVNHYRIDQTHSNAYTAWKGLGFPQFPSKAQYARLADSGQLQTLESPRWIATKAGAVRVNVSLPLEGLSLVELFW